LSISQATIEEVKNRIDILEVIGEYVNLKRSGQNYKGLSPFNNEKTPSFFVVPGKGIFKDFSSGKGGDAISFIMEFDGLSYPEAIRFLATKYGIEIIEDESTDEQIEAQNERESVFIVMKYAMDHFEKLLWDTEDGRNVGLSYFRERGYPEEIIRKFHLGYTAASWDNLMKNALESGFSEEVLEKAGLILVKESKKYDRFRGRVIFPIFNISGRPIAFGARTLKKEEQPKYLNSPETLIYHKSKVLYGLDLAKQSIRREDNCFLVEGYTDVISLHMAGIENVVSSSGTSLTEEQIRLIARYTKTITVLFDGDPAGLRASLRGIDMILAGGLNVKAVVLPEGEDPDSYSRQLGNDAFKDYLIDNATDFIRFKVELFREEAKADPIKKAEYIRQIVESIAGIPDSIRRTVYIKEASDLLDMDEQVLVVEMNKFLLQDIKGKTSERTRKAQPVEEQFVAEKPKASIKDIVVHQERESIRLLLRYAEKEIEDETKLYEYLFHHLDDIEFTDPVYSRLLQEFKSRLSSGEDVSVNYFMSLDDESIRNTVVDLVSEKDEVSLHWKDKYQIHVPHEEELLINAAFTNVLRLKIRVIRKLIEENKEKLKEETNPDRQEYYLKIHQELKKSEMDIAKPLGNIFY